MEEIEEKRLVYIKWADSIGVGSTWENTDFEKKDILHEVHSVGWVLHDGPKVITIIPHLSLKNDYFDSPEQACGDMTIPKSAILEIVDII